MPSLAILKGLHGLAMAAIVTSVLDEKTLRSKVKNKDHAHFALAE